MERSIDWTSIFFRSLQALEGKDVKDLLSNVGGGGAPAAGSAPAAAAGGAAPAEEKKEEKKEEEKEGQSNHSSNHASVYTVLIRLRLVCSQSPTTIWDSDYSIDLFLSFSRLYLSSKASLSQPSSPYISCLLLVVPVLFGCRSPPSVQCKSLAVEAKYQIVLRYVALGASFG